MIPSAALLLWPVLCPSAGALEPPSGPSHEGRLSIHDFSGMAMENLTILGDGSVALLRDRPSLSWSGLEVCRGPWNETNPDVAVAPSGDIVVVWQERSINGTAVLCQRYTPDGRENGSRLTIASQSSLPWPVVDVYPWGGFVVAWEDPMSGHIYAQRFRPDGTVTGSRLEACSVACPYYPDVACAPDGSTLVVWVDSREFAVNQNDIYCQLFDTSGAPVHGNRAISTLANPEWFPRVVASPPSGYVVVWTDYGNPSRALLQRLDGGAGLNGSALEVAGSGQSDMPDIARDAGGNLIVVWEEGPPFVSVDLYGRWFGPDGAPLGPKFDVCTGAAREWRPRVASAPDGSASVGWYEDGSGPRCARYQLLDAGGGKNGTAVKIPDSEGATANCSIAWRPGGGFVLAWDHASGSSAPEVHAGILEPVNLYRPSGVLETGELSPAHLVRWSRVTLSSLLPNSSANSIELELSTNSGLSWSRAPENGSLEAAGGARPLRFRALLSTSDGLSSPVLLGIDVEYILNHPPEVAPMPDVTAWKGTRVSIAAGASDPDGDGLEFLWTQLTGPAAELESSLSPILSFVPDRPGLYRFSLVAGDGWALSEPALVSVTVLGRPPEARLTASPVSPAATEPVLFNASLSSDPDGRVASFNFSFGDGVFTGWSAGATVQHEYAAPGVYGAFVLVRDDDGQEASSTVLNITVSPRNRAPRINSTPVLDARVGEVWEYRAGAEDDDGDLLSWELSEGPEGMVVEPHSGRVYWTPVQEGRYSLVLIVSDGRGGLDKQGFTLNVSQARPPPSPPGCTITHPSNGSRVRGVIEVGGRAIPGTEPLLRVEVRVDGGEWREASGTESWSFSLDTTGLRNGAHRIQARAVASPLSSEAAVVEVEVWNPPPGGEVTVEPFPWWSLLLAALAAAGAASLLVRRRD